MRNNGDKTKFSECTGLKCKIVGSEWKFSD